MSNYTKGPWKVYDGDIGIIYAKDGFVADVRGVEGSYFYVKRPQQERYANALLIATSQDLLEACKEVLTALTSPSRQLLESTKMEMKPLIPLMERVIAKAEGK